MAEKIISKYGGSSITNEEDVERIRKITSDDSRRKYVVVSAPGSRYNGDTKVTQLLTKLAKTQDNTETKKLIDEIANRYNAIYPGCEAEVGNNLTKRLKENLSFAVYVDFLKAFGEETNAKHLAKELNAKFVGAEEFLDVSEDFGNARILKSSYKKIAKLKRKNGLFVFPGFYGVTRRGEIATLSFGGSDLTGAILARGLDVSAYENFTDSPIYTANPKIVENPLVIKELTYTELRDLSYSGFNIFHQEAMLPLEGTTITTHIRSTKRYPEEGTKVVQDRICELGKPIVGIAYKGGFCSFSIEKPGLNENTGILYRMLGVFAKKNIPVEFPAVGIDDVSIVAPQEKIMENNVSRLKEELLKVVGKEAARVSFRENLGCLVVAGKGLQRNSRISGEIEMLLADNNIELRSISRGVEKRCLIYSIPMEHGHKAVNVLYEKFFS